jgi:branched-chain amino acid transport system substrate-binding protein
MKVGFRPLAATAVVTTVALVAAGCGGGSGPASAAPAPVSGLRASAPGVTPKTITIGLESDLTGVASSTFSDTPQGVQARFDLQNAAGGVDGRKLVLVSEDTQSNPTVGSTAAQELVQIKHVFGVIGYSALLFLIAKYFQQQGIPVVGSGFDGPEWNELPNTNMFSDSGTGNPADPATTTAGKFLKAIGVTKLAGIAYGISPSASDEIKAWFKSAAAAGIQNCYENLSVPFGSNDFTATVLQIKAKGCNGVVGALVDTSDVALSTALQQAGYHGKQIYYTGYDQSTLDQAGARQASQGDYYDTNIVFSPPDRAVAKMLASLRKYDPSYHGGLPDLGLWGGWEAADLMIKGLEVAGKNPTRPSFITNLRKVTNYTISGLAFTPVNFTTFGKSAQQDCQGFVQLKGDKFVDADPGGKPVCGRVIPNSYIEPSLLGKG